MHQADVTVTPKSFATPVHTTVLPQQCKFLLTSPWCIRLKASCCPNTSISPSPSLPTPGLSSPDTVPPCSSTAFMGEETGGGSGSDAAVQETKLCYLSAAGSAPCLPSQAPLLCNPSLGGHRLACSSAGPARISLPAPCCHLAAPTGSGSLLGDCSCCGSGWLTTANLKRSKIMSQPL
ncbi:hypothetical protein KIL84_022376 [Mauremys mutica]|uniref:Uncharacterized protein n=1 Tax=Mauremys mutica TaxID=74926 RepID=A0A9D3X9X8_9SAUR|nr:hypothetical protein KIL84_022376 [Mauremys mutica]